VAAAHNHSVPVPSIKACQPPLHSAPQYICETVLTTCAGARVSPPLRALLPLISGIFPSRVKFNKSTGRPVTGSADFEPVEVGSRKRVMVAATSLLLDRAKKNQDSQYGVGSAGGRQRKPHALEAEKLRAPQRSTA
jgi:hypothetical protein